MSAQIPPFNDTHSFGMRLAAARKARGFSQTHLAALVGVSLPRYHAWERDNSTPNNIAIYRELCRQLDVTVDWLFFGDTKALSPETAEKLTRALG
ncbi:MAG: helix-turn-helix domain-containing protein [Geminicoccaceae bacterium]